VTQTNALSNEHYKHHSAVLDEDVYLFPPAIPDNYDDLYTPITYAGRQIIPGRAYRRHARYGPNPFSWQANYIFPATNGFAAGVSKAFDQIQWNAPLSQKPTLVMASRGDDILDPDDMEKNSLWLSKERLWVKFDYNDHDTFGAMDKEDGQMAIDTVRDWISCQFLTQGTCSTNAKLALALKERTTSKTTAWLEAWLPSWLH
jgi:hypothetical protein